MSRNYIAPEIEIIHFDAVDVICDSATPVPVPELLMREGTSVGDEKMSNLMN